MKIIVKKSFFVIFLLLITGCGFHLRQPIAAHTDLPAIQITSQLKNPQQLILVQKYLKQTGFTLTDTSAPITVNLLAMQLETRPYSYNALAKVSEYQLTQTLNYQLFDDHQKPLSPVIKIYIDRIYSVDQQNISGNNQESTLIQEELKTHALEQLAEQLNQTLKYIAQPQHGS